MINKAIIIGNVGQEPSIRKTTSGQEVANFSVATNEQYTNSNGEVIKSTDWHSISAFGNFATIASKFINKGSLVYIEGKLKNRSYVDKNGIERKTNEIELSGVRSALRVLNFLQE
jgi:single-strand DNA-binding protein